MKESSIRKSICDGDAMNLNLSCAIGIRKLGKNPNNLGDSVDCADVEGEIVARSWHDVQVEFLQIRISNSYE